MFDIKPAGSSEVFGSDKNHKKVSEHQEDCELSLVEALREQEREDLVRVKKQQAVQRERALEIKKEAGLFKNIHLDQHFNEKDVPVRVVSGTLRGERFDEKYLKKSEQEVLVEKAEIQEQLREEKVKRLEKIAQDQKQKEASLKRKIKEEARKEKTRIYQKKKEITEKKRLEKKQQREDQLNQIKQNLFVNPSWAKDKFSFMRPALAFSGVCLMIFVTIFSLRFVFYGIQIKDRVVVKGVSVVADLDQIRDNFQDKDFSQVVSDFQKIQGEINNINQELEIMGGGLPDIVAKIPFVSSYGSAKKFLEAGEQITQAMVLVSQSIDEFSEIENPLNFEGDGESTSLGNFLLDLEEKLVLAESHLNLAQKNLNEVNPNDLPKNYQERVRVLKENFPKALDLLSEFNQKQVIFRNLLGYAGPRKYLFLFQNNHETRATGGFIGSYGVLSIHNGDVKDLFVDGIFNPDGQLSVRVVPPKPIQKISTNWSTHDANWFPDFPTSAEKISWFYEKTGGPTVDGIITLTPTVVEKLLEVTGPIEMPEYGITVDSDNFIEATQFEVEEDYDKEENRPKKFIADLTPKVLDRVFSQEGLSNFSQALQILSEVLKEKHILIYSENSEIQEMVSDLGWSGEILDASKDYLMVVNSNVNGYKTDGVIDQKISHEIEIESDGSVIDTVTIKRVHNGGSSQYEWWNKVNANYMRVYVPAGSQLLEADGYTRETVESPVDYDKLGFERDDLVVELESSIEIDEDSGTEIWEEGGKTVFANWVYVSPQEKVQVSYKYRLPFRLDLNREQDKMDLYTILYQKQSGMNTSMLETKLKMSDTQSVFWQYPEELRSEKGVWEYDSNLEEDRFVGVVVK
ncbi:MAG: DUF4012 domain-containing protein [Candidatus Moranbacteria bacterium]|nr:DUF4012 domain-containing protein [Candidatus Moranbacteria bacterium]